jgi:hypothetical protein
MAILRAHGLKDITLPGKKNGVMGRITVLQSHSGRVSPQFI